MSRNRKWDRRWTFVHGAEEKVKHGEEGQVKLADGKNEPLTPSQRNEIMSKLLIIGTDYSFRDVIQYTRELGVYTIVTDFSTPEQNPLKLLADEYWIIDVKNIDELEARAKEEKITAVFAGNHEFCLDVCRELARRLSLPFYGNNAAYDISRNKAHYKELCIKHGLDVPKRYKLDSSFRQEDLQAIRYPVLIKPTDSCAQQGISVVHEEKDLKAAYEFALSFSDKKDILVEDYIDGDGVFTFCYLHKGKLYLIGHTRELSDELVNGRKNFCYGIHFGKFGKVIRENVFPKYEAMMKELGAEEGEVLFQGIIKDDVIYNLEYGYRLDGVLSWRVLEPCYHFSTLKTMVNYALGIETPAANFEKILAGPAYPAISAYTIWIRPGKVTKILGEEELLQRDDIHFELRNFREGMEVPVRDNMRNIAYHFTICAQSNEELAEKFAEINSKLHVYNEAGEEMLIYNHNFLQLSTQA